MLHHEYLSLQCHWRKKMKIFLMSYTRLGEIALWLRALVFLSENLSAVASTYMGWLITIATCNSSSRGIWSPLWIPVSCSTHEGTSPTHTCLEYKILKFFKDMLGVHVFAEGQAFSISYHWPCKNHRSEVLPAWTVCPGDCVEVFSQHRNVSVLSSFKPFNLREDKLILKI